MTSMLDKLGRTTCCPRIRTGSGCRLWLAGAARAFPGALVCPVLSLLTSLVLIGHITAAEAPPSTTDPSIPSAYCQSDYFKATCGSRDVIVVSKANYGRMRINSCVKENFGYIGCSYSVIEDLDKSCSGRHSCEIRVLDETFPAVKSCHEDLKSYLEVAYQCIKVESRPRHVCQSSKPILLTQPSGYLASITSSETRCGTADAPWIIEVLPGQKINITLMDFGSLNSSAGSGAATSAVAGGGGGGGGGGNKDGQSRVCRVYATIRENHASRSVTVCGGESRKRLVYVSGNNRLEVRVILTKDTSNPAVFMLHYQASGCPDLEDPPGGFVKRDDRVAHFRCAGDQQETVWTATCEGTTWVGESAKNCTPVHLEVTKTKGFSIVSLPLGVSIVIIVVLALVIGLLILAIGVVCLRRNRSDDDSDSPYQEARSIMLGERVCEHGHLEPKQTIVCTMRNAQTATLVTRMKDAGSRENDYASMKLLGPLAPDAAGYDEENALNHHQVRQGEPPPPHPPQCLDILHTPHIMRQHRHFCNGNAYTYPGPRTDAAEHVHYCEDPENAYEVEKGKLLGLDRPADAGNYCDATIRTSIYIPAARDASSNLTSSNVVHCCNKCGMHTFGKYTPTASSTDNLEHNPDKCEQDDANKHKE